ncbi:MAG: hypothetical protein PHF79_01630 [Candidatus Pacebacteria bacterium]|nr:hypothetical protein [Candidatus Paceibacterota bacterium]
MAFSCPHCDKVVSEGSTVILRIRLEKTKNKIVGFVAEDDLVCCDERIVVPKLFPNQEEARKYLSDMFSAKPMPKLMVVPARPYLDDALEMGHYSLEEMQLVVDHHMVAKGNIGGIFSRN